MRQLSYLHTQGDDGLLEACRHLSELPPQRQDQVLAQAAEPLAGVALGFVDPGQIQWRERGQRRVVQSRVQEAGQVDREARRELFIQQALDQAFSVQGSEIRHYVREALSATGRINTRHLPVNNARELLAVAHAIEVGTVENLSSEYRFAVYPGSEGEGGLQWLPAEAGIFDGDYFQRRDEFIIELIEVATSDNSATDAG